jgi:hypothetical protein
VVRVHHWCRSFIVLRRARITVASSAVVPMNWGSSLILCETPAASLLYRQCPNSNRTGDEWLVVVVMVVLDAREGSQKKQWRQGKESGAREAREVREPREAREQGRHGERVRQGR